MLSFIKRSSAVLVKKICRSVQIFSRCQEHCTEQTHYCRRVQIRLAAQKAGSDGATRLAFSENSAERQWRGGNHADNRTCADNSEGSAHTASHCAAPVHVVLFPAASRVSPCVCPTAGAGERKLLYHSRKNEPFRVARLPRPGAGSLLSAKVVSLIRQGYLIHRVWSCRKHSLSCGPRWARANCGSLTSEHENAARPASPVVDIIEPRLPPCSRTKDGGLRKGFTKCRKVLSR